MCALPLPSAPNPESWASLQGLQEGGGRHSWGSCSGRGDTEACRGLARVGTAQSSGRASQAARAAAALAAGGHAAGRPASGLFQC